MPVPCEYCGNKDKSLWMSQCIYKGDYPSHRAFVLSTFDPPCSMDAYDEGQRELQRDARWLMLKVLLVTAIAVAAVVLLFAINY